jgi:phytoene dehydrogenase-like protein
LSLDLRQVSTAEVIRTTRNMFRYGAPAIVEGGCGQVTRQLERLLQEQGGEIRLNCEVLQILQEAGRATGVRLRDKTTGEEQTISAPLVISDVGPRATDALLQNRRITQAEVLRQQKSVAPTDDLAWEDRLENGAQVSEAIGLKVHVLSDVSLIPHRGIMYCLDTQRIAGIVQPTNSDPTLAPVGKHLIISHQVIQSNNIEEERALALADLRSLFGEAFETHCRVLTMGTYRGEWPVNRVVQGEDGTSQTTLDGLYLVGDAVKPSGYLMVEGVAQSVNRFLDLLDGLDREQPVQNEQNGRNQKSNHNSASNVVAPPSRLNAIRWLWKAPGNSGKA